MTSRSSTPTEDVAKFKKFGEYLGLAFQIKDDLLDFIGNEDTLGKPIAKDLIENIVTLPLLYSLKNSNNNHAQIIKILKKGVKKEHIPMIRDFAEEAGGIRYSINKANELIEQALDCIHDYSDSPFKRSLIQLTEFTMKREF
jgi:octaprenyl-diphosphate synthase